MKCCTAMRNDWPNYECVSAPGHEGDHRAFPGTRGVVRWTDAECVAPQLAERIRRYELGEVVQAIGVRRRARS